eukprot:snap_masked-scaffold_27-processed-gene-0.31-mRNA-1 protein AED:1.00 eAED:1.00 QI:0/0/0/0/1/1/2/0/76
MYYKGDVFRGQLQVIRPKILNKSIPSYNYNGFFRVSAYVLSLCLILTVSDDLASYQEIKIQEVLAGYAKRGTRKGK